MYTMIPFSGRREMARPMFHDMFNDRFFRSVFDMNDLMGPTGFRVDIKKTENGYEMSAELPGVAKDQIHLSVENDVLTVSAEVVSDTEEKKEHYVYSERRRGHMERRFNLEGVDQDKITAAYKDGILTVLLPLSAPEPEKTARSIEIE